MHPAKSPSEFIYQRPFSSAPAVIGLTLNTDEPKGDEAKDNPDHHHTCYSSRKATAAFDYRGASTRSSPAILASEAIAGRPLQGALLKRDSPSPGSSLFQPIGQSLYGQPFFPTQNTTACIMQIPYDGTEPIVWQPPPGTNQAWQEFTEDNQDCHKRASNASESTVYRAPSSHSWKSEDAGRTCAAVGAVYDICLQATRTYLNSHHANIRARTSHSEIPDYTSDHGAFGTASACDKEAIHGPASDSTPSLIGPPHSPGHNQHDTHQTQPLGPIPPTSTSLLKNISGICNMIWAGSQRDRLAVLNVERMAVDNMARLLSWAETVALGDYDEWALCDEDSLRRVLDAGKGLCAWLGVLEATREMEDLEDQLMGVREHISQSTGNGGAVWEV